MSERLAYLNGENIFYCKNFIVEGQAHRKGSARFQHTLSGFQVNCYYREVKLDFVLKYAFYICGISLQELAIIINLSMKKHLRILSNSDFRICESLSENSRPEVATGITSP